MNAKLLRSLYEKYAREIYLYLVAMCHNTAMAEDVLQEVFLKAMLALGESHTNFRAWLYTVAKNTCINEMKKAGRQMAATPEEMAEQLVGDPSVERLLKNEAAKQLYEALLELEPRLREILLMQYYMDIPQEEIAGILKLSHENVRVLSHRARKKCRKIMEEKGYEI